VEALGAVTTRTSISSSHIKFGALASILVPTTGTLLSSSVVALEIVESITSLEGALTPTRVGS
jgi:hypothetical protein